MSAVFYSCLSSIPAEDLKKESIIRSKKTPDGLTPGHYPRIFAMENPNMKNTSFFNIFFVRLYFYLYLKKYHAKCPVKYKFML